MELIGRRTLRGKLCLLLQVVLLVATFFVTLSISIYNLYGYFQVHRALAKMTLEELSTVFDDQLNWLHWQLVIYFASFSIFIALNFISLCRNRLFRANSNRVGLANIQNLGLRADELARLEAAQRIHLDKQLA